MSAALWTSVEAAAATGGRSPAAWSATTVSIDTRALESGALFIALKGEARDGHDFVADALKRGAAAALVSRRPEGVGEGASLLVVKDTQAALEDLGRAARARSAARIAAITGSVGKTTTKEMLRLALAEAGAVAASVASYNNHWGVPLSLARMPRDAVYGVFEIGMNHEGEIRALARQVRPHVALITTVAPAHLEYFGTLEAIAAAKSEIFEGVEPDGAALLPLDNAQYGRLRAHAEKAGVKKILTFGLHADADARLVAGSGGPQGQDVVVVLGGERISFFLPAPGRHIAMNAAATLLATRELGVAAESAARGLSRFETLKGRGARFRAGGIDVIDESYNANPASMAAALQLLGAASPAQGGRRLAALGDMLELGPQGAALHRALKSDIEAAHADLVFLCGPQMAALWEALPTARRGAYAKTSSELAPQLAAAVRAGDVVLVKGSFGSRMAAVIEALNARSSNGGGAATA